MDEWERLDLAGRQITELLRTGHGDVDELLKLKDEVNARKRMLLMVGNGRDSKTAAA